MPAIVTLVSREPHAELVRYLAGVGFEVRPVRTPEGAAREGTLIWLPEPGLDERVIAEAVRAWLGAKVRLRVVVVTGRPVRLRELTMDTRGRVLLLPAPVFGWQLVDALRAETVTP
jgi:hypothetical protein